MPHLAPLAILHAGHLNPGRRREASVTGPAQAADLIDRLRATGAVLTYDPGTRTVRAGDNAAVSVAIS